MTIKIITTPTTGRNLKPGDLFSIRGSDYWGTFDSTDSIGELVYIRTNEPADSAPDSDELVYLITIERTEKKETA